MIGKRVVNEKPVPLSEVLSILEEAKKGGELEYWQRLTYDYAQKFSALKPAKAKEMEEELLRMGKVRESQAVEIVDLMPRTKEDVELIFSKERTKLEGDDINKVLDIVKRYRE